MRKVPVVLVGALVGVFGTAALAGAAPVTRTQVHDVTNTSSSTNPCTGLPGTQTVTYHLVTQTNIDASGGFHYMLNENGTVSFVPVDPTQPTFSGRFHINAGMLCHPAPGPGACLIPDLGHPFSTGLRDGGPKVL